MQFTSIELHNYGIYHGTHVLEFNCIDNKNITLIGAMNGRGKTTILESILVALYGIRSVKMIQDKQISYTAFIQTRMNKFIESNDCTYIKLSCITDDMQKIDIKRVWSKYSNDKKIKEALTVWKNNIEDEYLSTNWNYYVEGFLPFGIARFCFFDNEKISQIVDDDSFNQVKEDIKTIIGISTVDILIQDVDKLIKQKLDSVKPDENTELQEEKKRNDDDIENIKTELDIKEDKLSEVNARLENLENQLPALQDQFWSKGVNASLRRGDYEKKQREIQGQKKLLYEDINCLIANPDSPLYLCRSMLQNIYYEYKENEADIAKRYSSSVILEIRKKLIEKLTPFSREKYYNDLINIISSEFEEYTDDSIDNNEIYLSTKTLVLLETYLTNKVDMINFQYKNLLTKGAELEDQAIQIEEYLNSGINENEAKDILAKMKEIDLALFENTRLKETLEDDIRGLEANKKLLRQKRTRIWAKIVEYNSKNQDDIRIMDYATMTNNVMEEFQSRLKKQKLYKLQKNIETCFSYLSSKEHLVSTVIIDSESLNIKLIDKYGDEILKQQLSAGEKQMFAVSILWGLAISSGFNMPVVIDTPMARLDSAHRHNFVTKYLPNASDQVIVLSTDEELTGDYLRSIKDNINKFYTVVYDEEKQQSFIHEGYFEEGAL